jgi:hypothetical protein
MKNYISLSIQLMEIIKKLKNEDGTSFYDDGYCSNKTFFKHYLTFAKKHELGLSRTAYDKGILSVMEALGFIIKDGDEIKFGKTNFEEYLANEKKEKNKEAKK